MVRLQTRIPSLSNSPRMRSAPQSRLSLAISLPQGDGLLGDPWCGRSCPRLVLPKELEALAMPSHQRLWLDNEQRLLPGSDHPGQKHQEHPIRCGTGRSFHLSPQDDQRLSQEGVFCDQFGLTSRKVGQRSQDQSGGGWCGPVNETLMERPKTQACQPCDERENPLHSVRSPL
jgi:hypothetical protein